MVFPKVEEKYITNIIVEDSMRTYSLYDVFVRNKNIFADTIALIEGEDSFTFHELHQAVLLASAFLTAKGVGPGDRVALLSVNRSSYFILLGALAKLGAVMVPLNWRLSSGELSYILDDSSPKILFYDQMHKQMVRDMAINSSVDLRDVMEIEAGFGAQFLPETVAEVDVDVVDQNTPLCIIYTAAVEGHPRGAVLSHGNLLAANMQVIISMGLTGNDMSLNMLPLFHITGLNLAIAVMQVGGCNVVVEKFNEKQVLALTTSLEVTLWGSFPPILSRIMEELKKGGYNISSLKYVVGLDSPDTIVSFEEISTAKFWILYGQSETSGFVTFSEASEKLGSAGKQGCLTSFTLVDDDDTPVAVGEVGEIVVRGPLIFQGYWKQQAVNEKTFRNGWHHTGDLGQVDKEGYLYYKGRKPEKELIKPGGENVYPAEVETAILEHSDVDAVCVIGVPDPQFGEGIKAICVLTKGRSLAKKDLIEFVAGRIARYKKPQYVEYVDYLPYKDGQVDRSKVKELWGA